MKGKVCTPFGFKHIGDLNVGDQVSNPDGSIARVLAVHELGGRTDLYEVVTIDDASTVVTGDHLWVRRLSGPRLKADRRMLSPAGTWEPDTTKLQVVTTEMLSAEAERAKGQQEKGQRPNWPLIPLTAPVQFTVTARYARGRWPIEPYALGVLLGDGSFRSRAALKFTSADPAIVERFGAENVNTYGPKGRAAEYGVVGERYQQYKAALKKWGLLSAGSAEKFVPEAYKVAPLEVRLALMQGLMDTDGYVDGRGHIDFTTVSKRLAEDVQWITRSLGFKATIGEKDGHYRGSDGESVKCKRVYTVHISGDRREELFSLPRKRERCLKGINGGEEAMRRIVDVRRLGVTEAEQCRCITVNHPNGLYITDDFIVTHNSDALLMAALQYVDVPGYAALLFRRTYADLALPGALMDRAHDWLQGTAARWNGQEKTWTFPSGATITFGYLEHENDKYRYQGAECQMCVSEGTLILLENGDYRPVEQIKAGDMVMTLEGPYPVTYVSQPRVKDCWQVETMGTTTLVSSDHRMLSERGWVSPQELLSTQHHDAGNTTSKCSVSCAKCLMRHECQRSGLRPIGARAPQTPENTGLRVRCASSIDAENDYAESGDERGVWRQPQQSCVRLALLAQALPSGEPSNNDECLPHVHDHVRTELLDEDYAAGCHSARDLSDARSLQAQVDGQECIPSQAGAVESGLLCLREDGRENTPAHSPLAFHTYPHPYTMELRVSTEAVLLAEARISPAGARAVLDLRVAGVSHYVSYGGIISKNCGFDELTQFDESQYLYLFSRLRRLAGVDIPLRMRSASNPGGVGHDWVKARFVDGEDEKRVYVPARLADNPHLDQAEYIDSLNELDPVTLAQLLNGDWDVQPTGDVFPRDAVSFVDVAPQNAWRIRYWDKAGTAGGSGARTAGVRMSMTPEGVVYVEDSVTGRWEAFGRERMLRQVAELDRAAYGQVPVWVEQEPGSGGKESAEATIRNLRGFDVHAERPTGDKLVRARPFAAQWQAGNVRIVRGPWVSDYLNELAAFPLGVYKDQVDASSGAYNKLVGLGEHYWQLEEYEEDVAIGPRI